MDARACKYAQNEEKMRENKRKKKLSNPIGQPTTQYV
jgi:hypothetical protein